MAPGEDLGRQLGIEGAEDRSGFHEYMAP
jgi:hypothetical protein